MTEYDCTTDLATCEVFSLTGHAKLIAGPLDEGEQITLYEEYPDEEYYPCKDNGLQIPLTKTQSSRMVFGLGNYKALASTSGLTFAVETGY